MNVTAALKTNSKLLALLIIAYLAKYICNVFLARHFSPANYGDINIILRVITICLPMIMLGADSTAMRFLPTLMHQENKSEAVAYLHWLLRMMVIACVCVFIFFLLAGLLLYITDHTSIVGNHYDIWLAAFLLPFFILVNVFNKLLKCYGRYTLSILTRNILKYSLFTVFLAVAFYIFETVNFYAAFSMLVASMFVVMVVQIPPLFSKLIEGIKAHKHQQAKPEWLTTGLSFMMANLLFTALNSIDLLALEILSPSESDVGYLSAIMVISSVLFLVSQASALIVNTKTSVCYERGDMAGVQKLVSEAFIFNIIFGLVFLIPVIIFGKTILGHFGANYVHLYPLLIILSIGCCVMSVTQNSSAVMLYTDAQREITVLNVIGLIVAIVLDVSLIPFFSIYGALVSMLVVGMGLNIVKCIRAKQLLKIKPFAIF